MIKILKFVPYLLASLIFLSTKVYADGHAIKIGVSFRMLSDVGYKHGELIKDTVAEWNEAGGINGHPIELTLYNDECKSEKGVANATKLAYEDKVHVIIGSSCSYRASAIIVEKCCDLPGHSYIEPPADPNCS